MMKSLIMRQVGLRSAARFAQPQKMSLALARSFATYYMDSHEYIIVNGDIGTVGVSGHAADALGDVVFVELPAVGSEIEAEESFGSVESVKAASDLLAPVSGEVVEVNSELEGTPGLVNESPFEAGWFIKVKMNDEAKKRVSTLMTQEKYDKFCEENEH